MVKLTDFQRHIVEISLEVKTNKGNVDYSAVKKRANANPEKIKQALKVLKEAGLIVPSSNPRWYKVSKKATVISQKQIKPERLEGLERRGRPFLRFDKNKILSQLSTVSSLALMVVSWILTYKFFSAKNPESNLENLLLSFGIVAGVYVSWTMGVLLLHRRQKKAVFFFAIWLFCFAISFTSTLASQRNTYNVQTADTKEDALLKGIEAQRELIKLQIGFLQSDIEKLKEEQRFLSKPENRVTYWSYNNTNMKQSETVLDDLDNLRAELSALALQESNILTGSNAKIDFYEFTAGLFGIEAVKLSFWVFVMVALIIDFVGPMLMSLGFLFVEVIGIKIEEEKRDLPGKVKPAWLPKSGERIGPARGVSLGLPGSMVSLNPAMVRP